MVVALFGAKNVLNVMVAYCSLTCAQNQCDQVTQRRRQQPSVLHASSAALPRNPANVAVALAAVLGSGTVVMLVTQSLITHGPMASRPANVGS